MPVPVQYDVSPPPPELGLQYHRAGDWEIPIVAPSDYKQTVRAARAVLSAIARYADRHWAP